MGVGDNIVIRVKRDLAFERFLDEHAVGHPYAVRQWQELSFNVQVKVKRIILHRFELIKIDDFMNIAPTITEILSDALRGIIIEPDNDKQLIRPLR